MIDDFEELKRKVENLKRERDQAVGARNQLLKRIREEFGCKTLEEAKEKLTELEAKERRAAIRYTKKKRIFEKTWKKVLEKRNVKTD